MRMMFGCEICGAHIAMTTATEWHRAKEKQRRMHHLLQDLEFTVDEGAAIP